MINVYVQHIPKILRFRSGIMLPELQADFNKEESNTFYICVFCKGFYLLLICNQYAILNNGCPQNARCNSKAVLM